MEIEFARLHSGDKHIDKAFRIALGDLFGNVQPYNEKLGEPPQKVILAGLDYWTPWTRDAAINVWNGASLLMPGVALDTLLSVIGNSDGDGPRRIGGQYWDAIIWVTGAWHHYLYTGDRDFLGQALEITRNSLRYFEKTEFDTERGLFRGPACYGDGVSAYPDIYADTGETSDIFQWPQYHRESAAKTGMGIPMLALSTNCLYLNAYATAIEMAHEMKISPDIAWSERATNLRSAIQRNFWMQDKGYFRYLADESGLCDSQEGLGHCFAILFGLANKDQADSVFQRQYVAPAGIPCVWPTFPRYRGFDNDSYGRHSGTVWPHVQGFWAHAAALHNRSDIFSHEIMQLSSNICRDIHCTEIYHPVTGLPYGGWQERGDAGISFWRTCRRQTWSATAFIRMVLMGLVGMRFTTQGLMFSPSLLPGTASVYLRNLIYRDMNLNIAVEGPGTIVKSIDINGTSHPDLLVPAHLRGQAEITVKMSS